MGLLRLPSRPECPIDRPFRRKSPLLPLAQAHRGSDVSVEHVRGSVYHPITISAPDLHSRGIDMTPGFVLAPKCCMTAAAEPFVVLLIFQRRTSLTGSWGDEIVPSGVNRIHILVLELFCCGHGRTKQTSGTARGDRRVNLTLDSARSRNHDPCAIRWCTPPVSHTRVYAQQRSRPCPRVRGSQINRSGGLPRDHPLQQQE